MRPQRTAEGWFGRTVAVGALILMAVAMLAAAGCGGDAETVAGTGTTTTETVTAETTESTQAVATTEATSETEGAAAADVVDDPAAGDDPFASFEVLRGVPDDYPDLEFPPGTELLEARGGELDPGTGVMTYVVVAAYDSQTPAAEQYDYWKRYLPSAGYQFVMDQMYEDPVLTFVMQITNADWSITVVGGDDDSEFIAEFPDAVHPFALVVAPAYLSQ